MKPIKLSKCPRCEDYAYEKLKSYGICHSCNLASAKDRYDQWYDYYPRPHYRTKLDPLITMNEELKTPCSALDLSKSRLERFYKILRDLPSMQRNIVFLKLWKNFSNMNIAYFMNIELRNVQPYLLDAEKRFHYMRCLPRLWHELCSTSDSRAHLISLEKIAA